MILTAMEFLRRFVQHVSSAAVCAFSSLAFEASCGDVGHARFVNRQMEGGTMSDSFAVHLGGGLYLDASGNLVFGPPTNAQIYQAPKGYSVDLKKIQETFKDLADILPKD